MSQQETGGTLWSVYTKAEFIYKGLIMNVWVEFSGTTGTGVEIWGQQQQSCHQGEDEVESRSVEDEQWLSIQLSSPGGK